MDNLRSKKEDGFRDEQYIVIPTEIFLEYAEHPLIKELYLTDVGFFPNAAHHYKEREEGIEENILIYCTLGKGIIKIDNTTYEICGGQAFCIPRNRKHKYYANAQEPWSIFWVHFKGDKAVYFSTKVCEVISINSSHANNRMMFLFDLLFRVLERNYTLGNFIYISQVLSLILSEVFFREKEDEISKQNKHVTTVIRYMYRHVTENITLTDISRELDLSKSYINAIFKKYAKRAPIDFFINLKMQEACKLLKSTDMYINEVGVSLGYDDQYYFSRIFKKVIGMSPKEYRNGESFHYK